MHVSTNCYLLLSQPPPWPSGEGCGHLDHVWSYGVREVMSSILDRGNIVGLVFHQNRFIRSYYRPRRPLVAVAEATRWLVRFSLIWTCLSFQILNLFRTLSSWGSGNYRPSAPLLYEVASHVKQLTFRPLLLFSAMILVHALNSSVRIYIFQNWTSDNCRSSSKTRLRRPQKLILYLVYHSVRSVAEMFAARRDVVDIM